MAAITYVTVPGVMGKMSLAAAQAAGYTNYTVVPTDQLSVSGVPAPMPAPTPTPPTTTNGVGGGLTLTPPAAGYVPAGYEAPLAPTPLTQAQAQTLLFTALYGSSDAAKQEAVNTLLQKANEGDANAQAAYTTYMESAATSTDLTSLPAEVPDYSFQEIHQDGSIWGLNSLTGKMELIPNSIANPQQMYEAGYGPNPNATTATGIGKVYATAAEALAANPMATVEYNSAAGGYVVGALSGVPVDQGITQYQQADLNLSQQQVTLQQQQLQLQQQSDAADQALAQQQYQLQVQAQQTADANQQAQIQYQLQQLQLQRDQLAQQTAYQQQQLQLQQQTQASDQALAQQQLQLQQQSQAADQALAQQQYQLQVQAQQSTNATQQAQIQYQLQQIQLQRDQLSQQTAYQQQQLQLQAQSQQADQALAQQQYQLQVQQQQSTDAYQQAQIQQQLQQIQLQRDQLAQEQSQFTASQGQNQQQFQANLALQQQAQQADQALAEKQYQLQSQAQQADQALAQQQYQLEVQKQQSADTYQRSQIQNQQDQLQFQRDQLAQQTRYQMAQLEEQKSEFGQNLALQEQQLTQNASQFQQNLEQQQKEWFANIQQSYIDKMTELSKSPRSWIDYWQAEHGTQPTMENPVAAPTSAVPQMPSWLSNLVGGWGEQKIPSAQQWATWAPSEQQGYLGYTDYSQIPDMDIYGQMQKLWPGWGSEATEYQPSYQRA